MTDSKNKKVHDTPRYVPIGIYRFSLALSVFISHLNTIYPPLDGIMNFGHLGVMLFFMISGYIIFSAYSLFYENRPISFLINRGLRIYPMLWLAYFSSVILLLILGTDIAKNISLDGFDIRSVLFAITAVIANMDVEGSPWSPLPQAWSLHVELKFYIFAVVTLFGSKMISEYFKFDKSIFIYVSGFIFLTGFWYVQITESHYRFFAELQYAPFFVLGASIYYINSSDKKLYSHYFITLISLISCFYYFMTTGGGGYAGLRFDDAYQNRTAISFGVMVLVFAVLNRKEITGWQSLLDRKIGDLTYPFYLFHNAAIALFSWLFDIKGLGAIFLLFLLCMAMSLVAHILLESRMVHLRNAIRGKSLYQ